MKYFKLFQDIGNAEDGAVTVDWVVLTAAVVSLGAGAMSAIKQSTKTLTTTINNHLSNASISTTL